MLRAVKNNEFLYRLIVKRKIGLFKFLVLKAYKKRVSSYHKLILFAANVYFGLKKDISFLRPLCHWFMDSVVQAQRKIHSENKEVYNLGCAEIGFEGLKVKCLSDSLNSSYLYLVGFCDNLFHFQIYKIYASKGSIAIDVGANIGIHSIVMSRCVSKSGKVFAFEPVKSLMDQLKNNLEINSLGNAVRISKGAGDTTGRKQFNFDNTEFNIGKGRVDTCGNLSLPFTTIDRELKPSLSEVSIIKIDTEGYELNVIKGAIETIHRHRPVIVIEFNPGSYVLCEITKYLPKEYSMFEIPVFYHQPLKRIGSDHKSACDLIFVPNEKSGKLEHLNYSNIKICKEFNCL